MRSERLSKHGLVERVAQKERTGFPAGDIVPQVLGVPQEFWKLLAEFGCGLRVDWQALIVAADDLGGNGDLVGQRTCPGTAPPGGPARLT